MGTPAKSFLERLLCPEYREHAELRARGKLVKFTLSSSVKPIMPTTGRGVIHTFSRASRKRMLEFIASIAWDKIPHGLFVTLTYPDSVSNKGPHERNKDRHRFLRYVEGYAKKHVPGVWRLEWEQRQSGAYKGWILPHMHFLLFGVKFIHHRLIRKWWRSILKVKGPLCTDVKAMLEGEMAGAYIAKYMSKVPSQCSLDNCAYLNTSGRHWGPIRKPEIHLEDEFVWPLLTQEQVDWLHQFALANLPWYDDEAQPSFTLLGKLAVACVKKFRDLACTGDSTRVTMLGNNGEKSQVSGHFA